ncbi:uncharacterized protein [Aristolochia californica]|uniref:uncharacterized protein n=1 Tax=Aristolochia californica TaxID=171875 RepID=UPI0035E207BA
MLVKVSMLVYFVLDPVSVAIDMNVTAQINNIPILSGMNFKAWKDIVEIVLGCMDLDLALRAEQPTSTPENLDEVKIEKWEHSNRMCLMIMTHSISEAFRGSITESKSAKKFLEEIEQYFAKNEKSEASSLLAKLVLMKYEGKGNIREYIMEMSHSRQNSSHLSWSLSYNTQKDKWYLNELISHCVQKKRGNSGITLKVLTWPQPLRTRRRREVRMLRKDLLILRNRRCRMRSLPATSARSRDT